MLVSILPGTFGQHNLWDIFTPASWSHPRVPDEILTDPQSMPAHPVLEGDVAAMHTGKGEQDNVVAEKAKVGPGTSNSHFCILEFCGFQADQHGIKTAS